MSRKINTSMTVGAIARDHPELIPELERFGIDYCCGGGRTLSEEAARIGIVPDAVVEELVHHSPTPDGIRDQTDCAAMTMTELADHIEQTHHAYARSTIDRIGKLLTKCVTAHGNDEPRLIELRSVFRALTDDMHDHFVREERVLFPWLRRLERKSEITSGPPWSVRRPIDCMIHDHDDVGEAFARIRSLTDDLTPPENACPTWKECFRLLADLERDTHRHIHKENNILFPAGIEAEIRHGHRGHHAAPHDPIARAMPPDPSHQWSAGDSNP